MEDGPTSVAGGHWVLGEAAKLVLDPRRLSVTGEGLWSAVLPQMWTVGVRLCVAF